MALPADQLSAFRRLKILITSHMESPATDGQPTAPEPGDLHAARRFTDAVADRAESAIAISGGRPLRLTLRDQTST
jgi:hypothetical protein